jgi:hypothetical protein
VSAYLNEHEVEDCERIFHLGGAVNLYRGAQIVHALMDYADRNSDGWHMWKAPRRAARILIDWLDHERRDYLRGGPVLDISEADLAKMLRPIKSFLTREKVDYNAALPWAALFPAA